MKIATRVLYAAMLVLAIAMAAGSARAQTFRVLYNFNPATNDPILFVNPGTLAQGQDGNIYTTSETSSGSPSNVNGYVFSMTPTGGLAEQFGFVANVYPNGCNPFSGLTLGSDGNFYGATLPCSPGDSGLVFAITPGGTLTDLHDFTGGSDGGNPYTAPVEGRDGNFYGTTSFGGASQAAARFISSHPAGP